MSLRTFFSLALALSAFVLLASRPAGAQFFAVPMSPDQLHSTLGLQPPGSTHVAGLVEYTLNDPFAYDPNNPAATSPAQGFFANGNPSNSVAFHGAGPANNTVTNYLYYNIDTTPSFVPGVFALDVWGRIDTCCFVRDNDFDVNLRSGGFNGNVIASQTSLAIPDSGNIHLRVTFNSPSPFDTVEIVGKYGQFTVMEVRGAAQWSMLGNVDNDNDVDIFDGNLIAQNFYKSTVPGAGGDITLDGFVDFRDFRYWKSRFDAGAGSSAAPFGAVPEPSAMAICLTTMLGLGCRPRRRD